MKAHPSVIHSLKEILALSEIQSQVTLKEIMTLLAGNGIGALLIVCSLPFCIPIPIPGSSVPFGLLIAFIGIRMAFFTSMWWPKWLLQKKIKSTPLAKFIRKTIDWIKRLQKIFHPRLVFLIKHPWLRRIHGIIICILGLILSLPLPLPLTNILTAIPLVFIGMGLLEEDGISLLIGYSIAFLGTVGFIALWTIGIHQASAFF